MLFYIGLGISLVLGLYVLLKTKRTYDRGKAFSKGLSVGWWILDAVYSLLVILSSLYTVWPVPINETIALVGGLIMLGVGAVIMLGGMIEFRSLRKISGLDTSKLVTTGIYQWSRNPQFFGLFLEIAGISLIGRSGFSFLLTIVAIIFCHYYITQLEEPYLERIFREKYPSYKSRTPRYIGIPKRREGKPEIARQVKRENRKSKPFDVMFETERADWYFIIPASLIFFFALLVTLWDFVQVQEMAYRLSLVNVVGLGLFLIGFSIRRVAKRTLGKYYSYGLRTLQNHELVKHGIYKHIRHPCNLAMLIYSPAISLFFSSLYGFLLMLGLIPCTLYRIKIEENMLLKKLGDEYLDYIKQSKKLIPYVY